MIKQLNINIDDVKNALKNIDAFSTNADKIRSMIGRGSKATIQKYLNQIRLDITAQKTREDLLKTTTSEFIELLAWSSNTATELSNALHKCVQIENTTCHSINCIDALQLEKQKNVQLQNRIDFLEHKLSLRN